MSTVNRECRFGWLARRPEDNIPRLDDSRGIFCGQQLLRPPKQANSSETMTLPLIDAL